MQLKCPVCNSCESTGQYQVTRADRYAHCINATSNSPARYTECLQCEALYLVNGDANTDGDFAQAYQDGSYYGVEGDVAAFMQKRFNQIISLPAERSDNAQRVLRINQYIATNKSDLPNRSVLDIGAGTGVFLHGFLTPEWSGTAIEPDPAVCKHLEATLPQVNVICGFCSDVTHSESFGLITFNRVIEHISDPVAVLRKERENLASGGVIYIEVPDTLSLYHDSIDNEAFGWGHEVVYSPLALCFLAKLAELEVIEMVRTTEPSGKFTLYGFLKRR